MGGGLDSAHTPVRLQVVQLFTVLLISRSFKHSILYMVLRRPAEAVAALQYVAACVSCWMSVGFAWSSELNYVLWCEECFLRQ